VISKVCLKCTHERPIECFPKRKDSKDGYRNECKKCVAVFLKKYAKHNSEKLRGYIKDYYQKNREKIIKRTLERKRLFPETHLENQRRYKKKKWAINIQFVLRERLSGRMRVALNSSIKQRKIHSSLEYLGCSIDELKEYIEKKFKPGMTWQNRAQWQIDHIRPCASFDLQDEKQQYECFHYSNLQPLWSEENRVKGSKFNVTSSYDSVTP